MTDIQKNKMSGDEDGLPSPKVVEGFVGWAGKMNQPLFKMYVLYIPSDHVMNFYQAYGSSMGLEALTLHPKRESKLSGTFSSKRRDPFLIIVDMKNLLYG